MKVVVIGGGASGMMAACKAGENGDVTLLEKNEKLGKKLFITGKGRGNVTNNTSLEELLKNTVTNSKFMYSAYTQFTPQDIMKFFEDNNCKLKTERGNRVFPESDHAYSLTDAFKNALNRNKVKIELNAKVIEIEKEENNFIVSYIQNCSKKNIIADKIIIATGGLSYPSTGSNGDGYIFAKSFGHQVTKTYPSLVGIETKNPEKELQGLSLKNVAIKIYNKKDEKKIIYKDFGEMLFTHYGVSGPTIISASSYITNRSDISDLKIEIDLKPALNIEELNKRILKDFEKYSNRELKNALNDLLPQKIIPFILYNLEHIFNNENIKTNKQNILEKKVHDITKEERNELIKIIKGYKMSITALRGFDEAVITKGGVNVKEISSSTMESKIVSGLYFVGEVLDVDCLTGGFNLTQAFSTAYLAGREANS